MASPCPQGLTAMMTYVARRVKITLPHGGPDAAWWPLTRSSRRGRLRSDPVSLLSLAGGGRGRSKVSVRGQALSRPLARAQSLGGDRRPCPAGSHAAEGPGPPSRQASGNAAGGRGTL